jgi:DNA-binding NarL/FixJ family response regulator
MTTIFGHHGQVNLASEDPPATSLSDGIVHVVLADSSPIQSLLLTRALRSKRDLRVSAVAPELSALQAFLHLNPVDVIVISANHKPNFSLLRWIHLSHPRIAPVLMVEHYDRELVLDAFRAGVKGIFLFNHAPLRQLCKCIAAVARGEIWINHQQLHYLLDVMSQVPALRVLNSKGRPLLTPREEQVVALVADGLSNREAAGELGLSEHTVKKYLLRIFDKLGISTRVELVLYAISHGDHRSAEWMPGEGEAGEPGIQ